MRNTLKTTLAAGLAVACLVPMAACGSGGLVGGSKSSGDTVKMVLVAKQEGIPWFDDMRTGVEQFGKDNAGKVDVKQIAPDSGDSAKQVQMVSDLISQDVDAIVVVPNDPQALKPVIKQAKAKGIVVIAHEASNIADDVDYDIEAFQNTDFGEAFCKPLAEGMGGKGKLAAVVGSKTMETHMAWYNSCKSMLEKDYPDIEFVSDEPMRTTTTMTLRARLLPKSSMLTQISRASLAPPFRLAPIWPLCSRNATTRISTFPLSVFPLWTCPTSMRAGYGMHRLGVRPMPDMPRSSWLMTRSKVNPSRPALI